jgi:DNA-binding phage protein
MSKTTTTRYDVVEHLRTPEEMAAVLEACLEEADGDAFFIAKAMGDIARRRDKGSDPLNPSPYSISYRFGR